ncbi:excalibur calcium-binding domain-containing protein [Mobilicoccus sp.]|uniref:excalibur calcium-binding domain-containing protein n=1 Tax=Mobilicoccus sp. TaxID=2034349 RepID=UPI00289B74CD|nr:excalibur calcium-binding domain-containing protein [Mobilicoccus sp.]
MNRALALVVAATAVAAPLTLATAPAADAATAASKYRNCAALHRDYPNGVGRRGAVDRANGGPKSNPVRNFTRNDRLYNSLSKSLDRDRDGIACERHTGGTTTKKPTSKKPTSKKPTSKKPTTTRPTNTSKGRAVSSPTGFAFISPSGNIMCAAGARDVRCDVTEFTYRTPKRPSWCDTDFGQAFGLRRTAEVLCAGDTLWGAASPGQNWFRKTGLRASSVQGLPQAVLPYGWTLKSTQIACTSTTKGVTCVNTTTKHGFTVAKASYRLF